jgi:hypothetical protein
MHLDSPMKALHKLITDFVITLKLWWSESFVQRLIYTANVGFIWNWKYIWEIDESEASVHPSWFCFFHKVDEAEDCTHVPSVWLAAGNPSDCSVLVDVNHEIDWSHRNCVWYAVCSLLWIASPGLDTKKDLSQWEYYWNSIRISRSRKTTRKCWKDE